jgi:hypothetical protein
MDIDMSINMDIDTDIFEGKLDVGIAPISE